MGEGYHEEEDDFRDLGNRDCFQQEPECVEIVRQLLWHFLEPIPPNLEPNDLVKRIRALASTGCQAEGWFKGEIMLLLSQMQTQSQIIDWWPEVSYDWDETRRRKCDFVLRLNDASQTMVGIEVKTAFVGRQAYRWLVPTPEGGWTVDEGAGQPWGLEYILTEGVGHNGGVLRDAVRLCRSEGLTERICLIYAYGEGAPSDPHAFAERLSALGENTPIAFSASVPNPLRGGITFFGGSAGFVQAFACWIKPPKTLDNSAKASGSK